jgi:hypothetical protein
MVGGSYCSAAVQTQAVHKQQHMRSSTIHVSTTHVTAHSSEFTAAVWSLRQRQACTDLHNGASLCVFYLPALKTTEHPT